MARAKGRRISISLSRDLAELVNRLARERSTSRSEVIATLLRAEADANVQSLMAEGYRAMSEENRREAEGALNLTSEVALRDD